jgi:hypothetical protein
MIKQAAPPNKRHELAALRRRYEKYKRQALKEPARFDLPQYRRRHKVVTWPADPLQFDDKAWQLRTWEAVASVVDAVRNERDEVSFSNVDVAAAVMSMTLLEWQREAPLGTVYLANRRADLYADLLLVGEHRFGFNIGGRLAEVDGLHAPSGERIHVIVEQLLEAYRENHTPVVRAAVTFYRFVDEQRRVRGRRLNAGKLSHVVVARKYAAWGNVIIPEAGDRWWLILE